MILDPDPCAALRCPDVTRELSDCEEGHCCHAWTKRARLDRQQREKSDRILREKANLSSRIAGEDATPSPPHGGGRR